jgi:hypothetical protein
MQSISGYITQKAFKKLPRTLQGSYLNHIETKWFKLSFLTLSLTWSIK